MSTKSRIVVFLALAVGLWAIVNVLLSGGLFAERIQHLVITPLRTHLGPDVTVSTVQLTLVPTRLTLKDVTSGPRWVRKGSEPTPPNLQQASEIIEILTLLQDKTKGNLTVEEDSLLKDMLYTLRITYVERAAPKA